MTRDGGFVVEAESSPGPYAEAGVDYEVVVGSYPTTTDRVRGYMTRMGHGSLNQNAATA